MVGGLIVVPRVVRALDRSGSDEVLSFGAVSEDGREFYSRIAPAIRTYEVDDGNGLASPDSEELIRDEAIELLIRYRTCCGPLASGAAGLTG